MSAPPAVRGPDAGWPPGRPRVLVTDAWLPNAGDAAIAVATDALVRRLAPTAAVLHAAYSGAELAGSVAPLPVVPALEHLLGTPWAPPVEGWEEAGARLVDDADLVLSQGGGFLVEAYEPRGRVAALAGVARQGRPVALVGQTIGPFRGAALRADLIAVLSHASLVVVRDAPSAVHATELGATDPVLGTDLALGLPALPAPCRAGVGVVLTAHATVGADRSARRDEAHRLLALVAAMAPDDPLVCFSTVQGRADLCGEDDAEVARAAVAALPTDQRRRVEVVPGHLGPEEVRRRIGGLRALVTMRLHPALFALVAQTPFALVLDDQRAGVLAGTGVDTAIARPSDDDAVRSAVGRALDGGPVARLDDLDVLVRRRAVVEHRVGALLDGLSTDHGSRTR